MTLVYKNNDDIQNCNNYQGTKLLSHTIKVQERVVKMRVRRNVYILENQLGFMPMPRRLTTWGIHLIRRLVDQYKERKRELHIIFVNLEKTYNKVPSVSLWKYLETRGVPVAYIKVIKNIYDGAKTCVRTMGGDSRYFPIMMGLRQG